MDDAAKRDALWAAIESKCSTASELHYVLNGFCEAIGVEPNADEWAVYTEADTVVLDALVQVAERHGWRP